MDTNKTDTRKQGEREFLDYLCGMIDYCGRENLDAPFTVEDRLELFAFCVCTLFDGVKVHYGDDFTMRYQKSKIGGELHNQLLKMRKARAQKPAQQS